jgi:adenine-specific DNA-methyltransferase
MIQTLSINDTQAIIELGDAVNTLKFIPDQSIDLVLTSPPYFIGKEYDRSQRWEDFNSLFNEIAPHISRILKDTGSVCWQVGNHVKRGELIPLDYLVFDGMQRLEGFKLRNRIIWHYSHGTHSRNRLSGRHETILWYTKTDSYYFDLDPIRIPQKYPGKRHYKGPKKGQHSGNPLGKNPGDFWEVGSTWDIPNVKANHVEKTAHPCQFPVALAQRLIRALCPKDGTVLDPFLGSGTTVLASALEGRNSHGIELDEGYFDIAIERSSNLAKGQLRFREDQPIRAPKKGEAVSQRPDHFIQMAGE